MRLSRISGIIAALLLWIPVGSAQPAVDPAAEILAAGKEFLVDGRTVEAYGFFRSFLPTHSLNADLYRWLAITAVWADRVDAAREYLEPALQDGYEGPLVPDLARYALARMYYQAGDPQRAKELLDALSGPNPPPLALVLQANLQALDGDYETALDLTRQALEADPDLAVAKRLRDLLEALVAMQGIVTAVEDQPARLEELAMGHMAELVTYMLFDAGRLNQKLIEQLEVLIPLAGDENTPGRILFELALAVAQWAAYGFDNVQDINDRLRRFGGTVEDDADGLTLYSMLLKRVYSINLVSYRYGWAYKRLQELEEIFRRLDQDRDRLRVLYALERMAYQLGDRQAGLEYRRMAGALVQRLAKRTRGDFLLPEPGIPLMMAFFLACLGLPAVALAIYRRAVRTDRGRTELSSAFKERLCVQARRLTMRVGLQFAHRSGLALAILVVAVLLFLIITWWLFPEWYRALYPYTGVSSGLWWSGIGLLVLTCLGVLWRRIPGTGNIAQRLDRTLGTRGLHESYLAYAYRHQGNGDFLRARMEHETRQLVPRCVVPLRRDALRAAASILLLLALVAVMHWLPPPPAEILRVPEFSSEAPLRLVRMAPPLAVPGGFAFRSPAGAPVGLDISEHLVPEQQSHKLEDISSIGGLDDKGSPEDYYSGVPERDWDYPRQAVAVTEDSGALPTTATTIGQIRFLPRQLVPPRYRGVWR
ncbi:tetratricopeptide repeat protein [Candidatus Thiosymbion oneisti]|uniref:tetratricopeptide repeat protein n=1 Tax=Candidatus Thiosymbion oneisti TaxID=589554 RepID=UPI00105ED814|nr:hypothetical protein [Candidatus Thiosymbion oneisti]